MSEPDASVSILLGGDTVPTESNSRYFTEGKISLLVDDGIRALFERSDLRLINLEVPLVDQGSPIEKCGPALIAPRSTVRGLVELGVDTVSLANNHIMDQGPQGLASTIDALSSTGIQVFGAGTNRAEAAVPFIIEKRGIRIGAYACAEHEFSIAGESSSGANPFDSLYSLDQVAELKASCDFVVVLYHGGKEHYRYPSPRLMMVCHRLAEKGADLVVCQHSHCVGCVEEWAGSTIVYGQGNFLFDHSGSVFWQTGLLIEVAVGKNDFSVNYVPLRKDGPRVRVAQGADAEGIIGGFNERSRQILEPGFVEREYAGLANDLLESYVRPFVPGTRSFLFRALNKLLGGRLMKVLVGHVDRLAALNYIECESHRELFSEALKQLSGRER